MPASKKRVTGRNGLANLRQIIPANMRDWVHVWHGVQVEPDCDLFHLKERRNRGKMPWWQKLLHPRQKSLFWSIETISNPRKPYKDFLYVLLNANWPTLLMILMSIYVFFVLVFATSTYAFCNEPATYWQAFNLSYQTFSTIGFGVIFPQGVCANMMMVLNSLSSLLVNSAITGLVFAKFAKPKAKIAFSKCCVVQPYGKEYLALVMRVANATQSKDMTHDVIMECAFRVNMIRVEIKDVLDSSTHETSTAPFLCSYNLKLHQNNFITFRMGLAVVHVIDEESPLFGMTGYDILNSDMIFEVAISGVDSTLQDTVMERHVYAAEDIRWGYRFAELLDFDEEKSELIMDFNKLSEIECASIDETRYIRQLPSWRSNRNNLSSQNSAASIPVSTTSSSSSVKTAEANGKIPDKSTTKPRDLSRGTTIPNGDASVTAPAVPLSLRRHKNGSKMRNNPPMSSPTHPHPSCLDMEPLFEPLLQVSVGTQRLHNRSRTQVASTAPRSATAMGSKPNCSCGREDFHMPQREKTQLHQQLAGQLDALHDPDESEEVVEVRSLRESDLVAEKPKGIRKSSSSGEFEYMMPLDPDRDNGSDISYIDAEGLIPRNTSAVFSNRSVDFGDTPRYFGITPINIPSSYGFALIYNGALHLRWPKVILILVSGFVVLNLVFGLIYYAQFDDIVTYPEVHGPAYLISVFLSVHTLGTIGYGSISPNPSVGLINICVIFENILGLVCVTIFTGIAWSKFARPRAHIHFSNNLILSTFRGHRCLIFRAANTRHSGDVHDILFRVGVVMSNHRTGLRQLYDVPLVTAEFPSIKLPATLIHIIDESSPFYRIDSTEDLASSRVSLIVLVTGLDTTFCESVYARKMYFWDDFALDQYFSDFALIRKNSLLIDFTKFDTLEPELRISIADSYPTTPFYYNTTLRDND